MMNSTNPVIAVPVPKRHPWHAYVRATAVAFWGVHVAAVVGVISLGFSWRGVGLALGSYFIRMFVVTAAYHRYFSHRAFKTSRWFQFVLALGAQSAAQERKLGESIVRDIRAGGGYLADAEVSDYLNELGIDTVLLSSSAPLCGALKESNRWRLVYDDGVALVFRSTSRPVVEMQIAAGASGAGRDREVTKSQALTP